MASSMFLVVFMGIPRSRSHANCAEFLGWALPATLPVTKGEPLWCPREVHWPQGWGLLAPAGPDRFGGDVTRITYQ
jgi:hypothetical protein